MLSNTERLSILLGTIRHKWGAYALARGTQALRRPPAPFSTTFPSLDALLDGGIPRSAVTELLGSGTSGATSLAFCLMAQAQREGEVVTYLDLARTFDPFAAEVAGIALKSLLLSTPDTLPLAMAILDDLARGASGLIVVNHTAAILHHWQGAQILQRALDRLTQALQSSSSAVLFLSPEQGPLTPPFIQSAALRLYTEGRTWRRDADGELCGYRTTVMITKAPRHEGRSVALTFPFLL